MRAGSHSILLLAALCAATLSPVALGHARINSPTARVTNAGMTTGPCGTQTGATTPVPLAQRPSYAPGAVVTGFEYEVTIPHDPADVEVTLGVRTGTTDGAFVSLLAETSATGGGKRTPKITVPAGAAATDDAVIQLKYTGDGNTYYSCSDVRIVAAAASQTPTPTPTPSATPKVYPPAGERTLKDLSISAWNVQDFGDSKMNSKPGAPEAIASTIARHDALLMQEISNVANVSAWEMLDMVNTPPVYTAHSENEGVLGHFVLNRETRELTYHIAYFGGAGAAAPNITIRKGAGGNVGPQVADITPSGAQNDTWFNATLPALSVADVDMLATPGGGMHLELKRSVTDIKRVDILTAAAVDEFRIACAGSMSQMPQATAATPSDVDFIFVAYPTDQVAQGSAAYRIAGRPGFDMGQWRINGGALLSTQGTQIGPLRSTLTGKGSLTITTELEVAVRDGTAFLATQASTTDDSRGRLMLLARRDSAAGSYKLALSPRVGTGGAAEQFGLYYRDQVLKVNSHSVYADPDGEFSRPPMIINLSEVVAAGKQAFTLNFVGVHLSPDEAVKEIGALVKLYDSLPAAAGSSPAAANAIIMGDFNAACTYVSAAERANITLWTDARFYWPLPEGTDTTVRDSTNCTYDRFVIAGEPVREAYVPDTAAVYRFDLDRRLDETAALEVSDHYPIDLLLRSARITTGGVNPTPSATPSQTPTPSATPIMPTGSNATCNYMDTAATKPLACRCGNGVCEYDELRPGLTQCPLDCGALLSSSEVTWNTTYAIGSGIAGPGLVAGEDWVLAGTAVEDTQGKDTTLASIYSGANQANPPSPAVAGARVRFVVSKAKVATGPQRAKHDMYLFTVGDATAALGGATAVDAATDAGSVVASFVHGGSENLYMHPAPEGHQAIVDGQRAVRLVSTAAGNDASAIAIVECVRVPTPSIRYSSTRALRLDVYSRTGSTNRFDIPAPAAGESASVGSTGTTTEMCDAITAGEAVVSPAAGDADSLDTLLPLRTPGFSLRTYAGRCGAEPLTKATAAFWLEADLFDPLLIHFDVHHAVADATKITLKSAGGQTVATLSDVASVVAAPHARGTAKLTAAVVAALHTYELVVEGAAESTQGCTVRRASEGFMVAPRASSRVTSMTLVAKWGTDGTARWIRPLHTTYAATGNGAAQSSTKLGVMARTLRRVPGTDDVLVTGVFEGDLQTDADRFAQPLRVILPTPGAGAGSSASSLGSFVARFNATDGEVAWVNWAQAHDSETSGSASLVDSAFSADGASLVALGTYSIRAQASRWASKPVLRQPLPAGAGGVAPFPDQTPATKASLTGEYHGALYLGYVRPFPAVPTIAERDMYTGVAHGSLDGAGKLTVTVYTDLPAATSIKVLSGDGTTPIASTATMATPGATISPITAVSNAKLTAAELTDLESGKVTVLVETAGKPLEAIAGKIASSPSPTSSGYSATCNATAEYGVPAGKPICTATVALHAPAAGSTTRMLTVTIVTALGGKDAGATEPLFVRGGATTGFGTKLTSTKVFTAGYNVPEGATLTALTDSPDTVSVRVSNTTFTIDTNSLRMTYNGSTPVAPPEPSGPPPKIIFQGALDGVNVEPPVEGNNGFGAVYAAYNSADSVLELTAASSVDKTTVDEIIVARGARSESIDGVNVNGPTIHTIAAADITGGTGGGSVASVNITLSAGDAASLMKGDLYVQFKAADGSGILRAQLLSDAETLTAIGGREAYAALVIEGDGKVTAGKPARGVALIAVDKVLNRLHYMVAHDINKATDIHLHGPADPGADAGVLVNFQAAAGSFGVYGAATVNAATLTALKEGKTYVNIHSEAQAGGAARGQVTFVANATEPATPATQVVYAELSGNSADLDTSSVAQGRGLAHLVLDREAGGKRGEAKMTVHVAHNIVDVSAVHIHGPTVNARPETETAGVMHTIAADAAASATPIAVEVTMTKTQRRSLFAEKLYLNVHSTAAPNGRIRGYLTTRARYTHRSMFTAFAVPTAEANNKLTRVAAIATVAVTGPYIRWRVFSSVPNTDARQFAIRYAAGDAGSRTIDLYMTPLGGTAPAGTTAGFPTGTVTADQYVTYWTYATPYALEMLNSGGAELVVRNAAGAVQAKGSLEPLAIAPGLSTLEGATTAWDIYPSQYGTPKEGSYEDGGDRDDQRSFIAKYNLADGSLHWARPMGDLSEKSLVPTTIGAGDLDDDGGVLVAGMLWNGAGVASASATAGGGGSMSYNATFDLGGVVATSGDVTSAGATAAGASPADGRDRHMVVMGIDKDLKATWATVLAPSRKGAMVSPLRVQTRSLPSGSVSHEYVALASVSRDTVMTDAGTEVGQDGDRAWAAVVSLERGTGAVVSLTPLHPSVQLAGTLTPDGAHVLGASMEALTGPAEILAAPLVALSAAVPSVESRVTAFAITDPLAAASATPTPGLTPTPEPGNGCPQADIDDCKARGRVYSTDVCACLCADPLMSGTECDTISVGGTLSGVARQDTATFDDSLRSVAGIMGTVRGSLTVTRTDGVLVNNNVVRRVNNNDDNDNNMYKTMGPVVRSRKARRSHAAHGVHALQQQDIGFVARLADASNRTAEEAATALLESWEDTADFRLQAAMVSAVHAGDVTLCRDVTCPTTGESCISGVCTTLAAAKARHAAALDEGSSASTDGEDKSGMPVWMIAAIAGGGLLVLGAVIAVVLKVRGGGGGGSGGGGGGGGGGSDFRHGEFSDVSAANSRAQASGSTSRQRPREAEDDPFGLPPAGAGGASPPPPPPPRQYNY